MAAPSSAASPEGSASSSASSLSSSSASASGSMSLRIRSIRSSAANRPPPSPPSPSEAGWHMRSRLRRRDRPAFALASSSVRSAEVRSTSTTAPATAPAPATDDCDCDGCDWNCFAPPPPIIASSSGTSLPSAPRALVPLDALASIRARSLSMTERAARRSAGGTGCALRRRWGWDGWAAAVGAGVGSAIFLGEGGGRRLRRGRLYIIVMDRTHSSALSLVPSLAGIEVVGDTV